MADKTFLGYLLILCIALTSCEKVVEVDLNAADPQYVIEGIVTNVSRPNQVRVSQTKAFNADNDFEGISHAEVVLSDDLGNRERLAHADSGIYIGDDISGVPGRTYSLSVTLEGETFTATSTMPQPVHFRGVYADSLAIFGEKMRFPRVAYNDPAGIDNYYRHVLYINGQKRNPIYVSSDELYDGEYMERALRFGEPGDILGKDDTVTVEMQTIDEAVYEYFSTLSQTINRSAASPANPESNISGGALGYFSAHTVQTRSTTIE